MAKKGEKDLFHGTGNDSLKGAIPCGIKNKAGKTNPEQKNAGKLLPTKKKTQKGWSK
jgi:hypothetical protein